MTRILRIILSPFFVSAANAQGRVECEYDDWVDVCDAKFERQGSFVILRSNKQQCSGIDWYTGAQPRLTIVVNGEETVELLGATVQSEISISACNVCKDSRSDTDAASLRSVPSTASAPVGPVAGENTDLDRLVSSWREVYQPCGVSKSG
jgi:hypothetical protein